MEARSLILSRRFSGLRILWLCLSLTLLLALIPARGAAQTNVSLTGLGIQLWPEYDRRDVLVIYRGQLPADTTLPIDLTFHLPARIGELNAVAVAAENSSLVNAPYQTEQQGDELVLTLTSNSRNFQFEYYDPGLLVREDSRRTLSFDVQLDYDVAELQVEVQEPLQVQEFQLTPPAVDVFTDQNGLRYHQLPMGAVEKGSQITLAASYQRETDTPSAEALIFPAEPLEVAPETPAVGQAQWGGYALIALGGLLLAGAGGYWWWSSRRETARRASPRRLRRERSRPARPTPPAAPPRPRQVYCTQCGTPLHKGARFCHNCGAPRRDG